MNEQSAYGAWIAKIAQRGQLDAATIAALRALPIRSIRVQRHRDWRVTNELLTDVHIVASGVAASFSQAVDGRRQLSSIYLPGDACDLEAMVLPSMNASWTALRDLDLVVVSHSSLRALVCSSATLAEALWQEAAIELQMFKHRAFVTGTSLGAARLAHLVCELSERYAQLGHPRDRFPLEVTQTDIGEIIGLTPVHVNRQFRVLREMGLVSAKIHGDVVIEDRRRLTRLAGFDPSYMAFSAKTALSDNDNEHCLPC